MWRSCRSGASDCCRGVLLAAHHTALLVTGEDKVNAVRAVFEESFDPMKYPAQIGMRDGKDVEWFLDRGASKLLGG